MDRRYNTVETKLFHHEKEYFSFGGRDKGLHLFKMRVTNFRFIARFKRSNFCTDNKKHSFRCATSMHTG